MFLELTVNDIACRVRLVAPAAGPVRHLIEALPLTDAVFLPSCWSGPALEVDLSGTSYGFVPDGEPQLISTLPPGTLTLRRDRKILEISYGPAESRSASGPEYGVLVGQLDASQRTPFLAELASSHDVGELHGSIRIAGPAH